MRWYSGPIQDAIASAKHDQKIFLVFVEGKDETSKTMSQIITEEDISKIVDEHCVSVKLITDSEPFRQFSQIYPVIVVPSMFLIGNNGIPLEVIAGSEDKEELILKIQKAIQLHKSKLPDTGASVSATSSASSKEPVVGTSASAVSSTSMQEPAIAQEPTSVSDKEEYKPPTKEEPPSEAEEANAQALLKQKLERAEQLMAERRRLREQEEKEAERDREMETRRAGRELQRAREQMKEKEMADWAKQRQKEKQEDKAARERVLAQIAQDKADRAARFQYSGSSPPPSSGGSEESPSLRQRSPESASAGASNQATKIQFRLPNSQAISQEFPAGSTLNDVVQHVNQVIKPGVSAFSLATSFPRRHFTKADHSRTLRELELCPSAVLLVLPASAVSATSHSSNNGRFWALVWTVLSPLTVVWNFLYSFVFGSGPTQQTAPVKNDVHGSATSDSTAPQNNQRSAGNKAGSNQKPTEPASRYRRDGNIHHLSNESSNDDEDGTWNGNSTQQM